VFQAVECRYLGDESAAVLFVYTLFASAGAASAHFAASQQAFNGSGVGGIGDAAFYESQAGFINVLKGDVFFTIAAAVAGVPQRTSSRPRRRLKRPAFKNRRGNSHVLSSA
jgi:hypothetical protein